MLTPEELQERILTRLTRGACGPYQLADEIGEPPFRIIAELKQLDRLHQTREHPRYARLWRITTQGRQRLGAGAQLTFGGWR